MSASRSAASTSAAASARRSASAASDEDVSAGPAQGRVATPERRRVLPGVRS